MKKCDCHSPGVVAICTSCVRSIRQEASSLSVAGHNANGPCRVVEQPTEPVPLTINVTRSTLYTCECFLLCCIVVVSVV